MQRLKKGDEVIVTAGKDNNVGKKHQRPNPNTGTEGGIVDVNMPIHASNLMHVNPASGKGERIGYKTLDDGKKVRYFRSNGESLD